MTALFAAVTSSAATLKVPDQFATIQAAVDAAQTGDSNNVSDAPPSTNARGSPRWSSREGGHLRLHGRE